MQLAAEGVKVCMGARRTDLLESLRQEIESRGGSCVAVVGDVTEPSTRQSLIDRCVDEWGGIDLLINNAGIGAMGRFDEADSQRLRRIFEVNFFSIAELTRDAIPWLKKGSQPMIVNISSVLGHRAAPLKSEYSSSKFAIHGLSDAIRAELARDGIDVLLVSPSTTDSDFFDSAIEDTAKRNWKRRGAMSPEKVASKTIWAIKRGRHEIILSWGGRMLVWLDRLASTVADRILARYGN